MRPPWPAPALALHKPMEHLCALIPKTDVTTSPEVFQLIGTITCMPHDTLQQLGVMPKLQQAADRLADARSRLT